MQYSQEITQLLNEISGGNRKAVDTLMPAVYKELKKLAQSRLKYERRGHTLNATALVHEAYFKMVDQRNVTWQNKAHFFGVAAQAMRRILINYAAGRVAQKRGGGDPVVTFSEDSIMNEANFEQLLELDTTLLRLMEISEKQAKIIEYWFFVGLTHEEIAEIMDMSLTTVRRNWRIARAWLSRELSIS